LIAASTSYSSGSAAIGFVALFCGVVNCPFASLMLALEVFGAEAIVVFAAVCGISYMMSGNFGLYKSQKIVYSKINEEYIDINTK
jgi:H+/Cl- antiporter ClcA